MPVAGIQLAISGGWRITIKAVINNWLIVNSENKNLCCDEDCFLQLVQKS